MDILFLIFFAVAWVVSLFKISDKNQTIRDLRESLKNHRETIQSYAEAKNALEYSVNCAGYELKQVDNPKYKLVKSRKQKGG